VVSQLAGTAASAAVSAMAVGAVGSGCTAILAVTQGPAVGRWIADHAVIKGGDAAGKSKCLQCEGQGGEEEFERHHLRSVR
jgi:hypothetical protein